MQQLHVDIGGTPHAPTILFLHGVGAAGYMWSLQTAALTGYHTLTADLPGHGQSRHVEWQSLKDTADHVAALIRTHATGGRAHVVGLSLGGYVALTLAEHHPALVDHLIVSGITTAPMPNRWLAEPQVWLMALLKNSPRLIAAQARSSHVPPAMHAAFATNLRRMSIRSYRRILKEVAAYSAPPTLRHLTTPTLITAGGAETAIITAAVAALPRLMPNARGLLAPGLGHAWNVQAPDLFTATLRAWLTHAPLPGHPIS